MRDRSPDDEEFGRGRRRSESPGRGYDVGGKRGRGRSLSPRSRQDHGHNDKRRRHSSPGGRRREGGAGLQRGDPREVRDLYELGHLLSASQFNEKMRGVVTRMEEAHEEDERVAVVDEKLKHMYVRYVETFKDDDGPVMGDALRFFHAHRDEEWFWERYDPVGRRKARMAKCEVVRANKEAFYASEMDWDKVAVSGLMMEADAVHRKGAAKSLEKKEGDEGDEGKEGKDEEEEDEVMEGEDGMLVEKGDTAKSKASPAAAASGESEGEAAKPKLSTATSDWATKILDPKRSVFIRTVPPRATRAQLEGAFKDLDGFERIVLSEPLAWKGWTRIAWARFNTEEQCAAGMKKLDGRELHPAQAPTHSTDETEPAPQQPLIGARFRLSCLATKPVADTRLVARTITMTASTPRRLALDLELLKELIGALDNERGVDNQRLMDAVEGLGGVGSKVDLLVHYLRRVHMLCYYRFEEFGELDEMLRKGAAVVVRAKLSPDFEDKDREWESALEDKVRARIRQCTAEEEELGGDFTADAGDAARLLSAFYAKNCVEVEKGQKYQCQLTFKGVNKAFKGPEFLIKHLWNKHATRVREEAYLMQFLMDPQMPTEQAQPQGVYQGRQQGQHMRGGMLMHPMRGGYGMGGRGGGGGHLVAGGRGGVGMRVGGMPLPPPHMMAMAMGIAMAAAGGFAPGGMMPIPPRMPNAANMPSPGGRAGGRQDPRGIKAYVDLDAAGSGGSGADVDYRNPTY